MMSSSAPGVTVQAGKGTCLFMVDLGMSMERLVDRLEVYVPLDYVLQAANDGPNGLTLWFVAPSEAE